MPCSYCKMPGHNERTCPQIKADALGGNGSSSDDDTDGEDYTALIIEPPVSVSAVPEELAKAYGNLKASIDQSKLQRLKVVNSQQEHDLALSNMIMCDKKHHDLDVEEIKVRQETVAVIAAARAKLHSTLVEINKKRRAHDRATSTVDIKRRALDAEMLVSKAVTEHKNGILKVEEARSKVLSLIPNVEKK